MQKKQVKAVVPVGAKRRKNWFWPTQPPKKVRPFISIRTSSSWELFC